MDDLEYIKNFSKITIVGACRKTGVNKSNLFTGRTSCENIKKVRKQIESDVAELYINESRLKDYDTEEKFRSYDKI